MRHSSSYGYQKKNDDYSESASGSRTYLSLVFNNTTKRPTRLGWIILIIIGLLIWHGLQEAPGPETESNPDDYDDRDINPRFRIMEPAIPNAQLGEFLAVREKNMVKGDKEVPVFDPNKHPVPKRVREAQRHERHERPRPKDYPVVMLNRPDVNTLCPGDLHILFVVDSVARDVNMREAIRRTWASRSLPVSGTWSVIFVIGSLTPEDDQTNVVRRSDVNRTDVLRGDFADSPHEGTRKFMLAMDWIVSELAPACNIKYVVYTKQRLFINVPLLMKLIQKDYPDPELLIYAGKLLRKDVPVRDVNDLNYVPPEDYDRDFFPDIISRPVYLFSMTAYRKLFDAKRHVTPIAMEDAYVGLLAEQAEIPPIHDGHFEMMKMSANNEKCNFIHRYFVYDTNSKDMRRIYTKFTRELKQCPL